MAEMQEELLFKTRESFLTIFSWKKFLVGLVIVLLWVGTILINFKDSVKDVLYIADGVITGLFVIYIAICMWLKSLHKIYIYREHIHERMGLFNVIETDAPIGMISAVTLETPFLGIIFNYGTVYLDSVGKIDIHSNNIKGAKKMKVILDVLVNELNEKQSHN
jgi:uncharacterized membrane protein YdbT with pleckstrin-like domain